MKLDQNFLPGHWQPKNFILSQLTHFGISSPNDDIEIPNKALDSSWPTKQPSKRIYYMFFPNCENALPIHFSRTVDL